MRTRTRFAAVALSAGIAAALAGACGGGGGAAPSTPTAPATPAPTPTPVLTVADGWTHAAVTGEANPPAPSVGARLSVRAPGYLFREQLFTGSPVYLWPEEEDYVDALVYQEFTDGSFRMVRWPAPFTITLDGDLASNEPIVAKVREVAGEIKRATGLDLSVGPGGACVIALNSNITGTENAVGLAELSYQGPNIVRAQVTFTNRGEITGGGGSEYRNTLLHEMGHVMGLLHSLRDDDVMTPGQGPGTRVAQYQPHEAATLHLMYAHRTAGNRRPDKDTALGATAAGVPRNTVIRD
ncbi:MAG TPA: hypothetical protein VFK70_14850 [Vicinamibacteria bacterium]|nr:hypothetical protein [Vicinamibacteria bacterium]